MTEQKKYVAAIMSDKMEFKVKTITVGKEVCNGKIVIILVILMLKNTYKMIIIYQDVLSTSHTHLILITTQHYRYSY